MVPLMVGNRDAIRGLHESEVMPLKPQRRVRDYVDCVVDGSQFGELHEPQNYDRRAPTFCTRWDSNDQKSMSN